MSDDEARFNSLAEPHLVGEDAATLGDAAQREHDGVDLARVGVDPPAALRGHLPPTFASAPEANELFRVVTTMDGMHRHGKLRQSANGLGSALGVAVQSWPYVLSITAAIVVTTGLLACLAPILRGLRIRPVEALRVDA